MASRPPTGLGLEAALKRWSDPATHARMLEFADAEQERGVAPGLPSPSPYMLRHEEYVIVRKAIEDALLEKLKAGTLLASGISAIEERNDWRKIIHPSTWAVLEIAYDFDEFVGPKDRTWLAPEIFEPSAIPTNIAELPPWLPKPSSVFEHDAEYRQVTINGTAFSLGAIQAKVVALLHEAARGESPWLDGKKLLATAGSHSMKMGDVFKPRERWAPLIESDRRGRYRLKLD